MWGPVGLVAGWCGGRGSARRLGVGEAVPDLSHRLRRVAVAFFFGEGLECRKMCWNLRYWDLGRFQHRAEPPGSLLVLVLHRVGTAFENGTLPGQKLQRGKG